MSDFCPTGKHERKHVVWTLHGPTCGLQFESRPDEHVDKGMDERVLDKGNKGSSAQYTHPP